MINFFFRGLLFLLFFFVASTVTAHPHAFITPQVQFSFSGDTLNSLAVSWEFDDMTTIGLVGDQAVTAAAELSPLEQKEIQSLEGFPAPKYLRQFCYIEIDETVIELPVPQSVNLTVNKGRLVYSFAVDIKQAVKKSLKVWFHDRTVLIAFSTAAGQYTVLQSAGEKPAIRIVNESGMDKIAISFIASAPQSMRMGNILQWLSTWQAAFNEDIARKMNLLKNNYSPEIFGALLATAFLYGVLHAAGPGHGKSIMIGWILTQKRSFADVLMASLFATFLHAFSAVAVVAGIYFFMGKYVPAAMGTIFIWMNILAGGLLVLTGVQLFIDIVRQSAARRTRKRSYGRGAGKAAPRSGHPLWIGAAIGIVPCPLAAVMFIVCLASDMQAHGLLLVAAFALGMGFTLLSVALVMWSVRKQTMRNNQFRSLGFLHFVNIISGIFFITIGALLILPNLDKL